MPDSPTDDRPDRSDENAKLELPSLSLPGFGRKKRRHDTAVETPDEASAGTPDEASTEPDPAEETRPITRPADPAPGAPPASTETQPAPARPAPAQPAAEAAPAQPGAPEDVDAQPTAAPGRDGRLAAARSRVTDLRRSAPWPRRRPSESTPPPVVEPVETASSRAAEPVKTPTQPQVAEPPRVAERVETRTSATATIVDEPSTDELPTDEPSTDEPPADEPPREPFRLPSPPTRVAVAITGLVVGVAGVALTFVGLQGCNAVRGTDTCGGGPGLLLLLVILAVMVLVGGALLGLWSVREARSTSFLAVGVLVVVALLTAQDVLLSTAGAVVAPLLTVVAYLLAHWVTSTFVDLGPEKGPQHDVR